MTRRRLRRRGIGAGLLGLALASVLIAPAWFILIERTGGPRAAAPEVLPLPAPRPAPPPPTSQPEPRLPTLAVPAAPASGPGAVRGRARDPQGRPGVGLRVWARPLRPGGDAGVEAGQEAICDEEGRFQLRLAPGAWLLACEGTAQDQLCRVPPGSTQEVELLAPAGGAVAWLRLIGPDGASPALPAALAQARWGQAALEGRGQLAGQGVRLGLLPPGAATLAVRVWPGDPRWLPWEGELRAAPLMEVGLLPAPRLFLRLRLAADQERVDLVVHDAATGELLAQRPGLGAPGGEDQAEDEALWVGTGVTRALEPGGAREVRLALGLPAGAARLRLVATTHRPLRHGEPTSEARRTREATLAATEPDALLDLR